jgi:hypothetical protein
MRTYPFKFGLKFASLIPTLISSAQHTESDAEKAELDAFDAKEAFANMRFDDLWTDAGMTDVIVYLRGNRHLKIPDAWRPYIPRTIQVEK